jgi:hypothetical protein
MNPGAWWHISLNLLFITIHTGMETRSVASMVGGNLKSSGHIDGPELPDSIKACHGRVKRSPGSRRNRCFATVRWFINYCEPCDSESLVSRRFREKPLSKTFQASRHHVECIQQALRSHHDRLVDVVPN